MNSCSASAAALKTAQSQLGMAINHTRQHVRPIVHALHCTITDLALCTASAQHICYLQKSLTTVPLYTYLILNPSVTPNPDKNTNSVLNQFAGGPPRSRINIYARHQQLSIDICSGRAPDLSSKPADRRCCCQSTGQTDGRTDTRPFHDAYCILFGPSNNATLTATANTNRTTT